MKIKFRIFSWIFPKYRIYFNLEIWKLNFCIFCLILRKFHWKKFFVAPKLGKNVSWFQLFVYFFQKYGVFIFYQQLWNNFQKVSWISWQKNLLTVSLRHPVNSEIKKKYTMIFNLVLTTSVLKMTFSDQNIFKIDILFTYQQKKT